MYHFLWEFRINISNAWKGSHTVRSKLRLSFPKSLLISLYYPLGIGYPRVTRGYDVLLEVKSIIFQSTTSQKPPKSNQAYINCRLLARDFTTQLWFFRNKLQPYSLNMFIPKCSLTLLVSKKVYHLILKSGPLSLNKTEKAFQSKTATYKRF